MTELQVVFYVFDSIKEQWIKERLVLQIQAQLPYFYMTDLPYNMREPPFGHNARIGLVPTFRIWTEYAFGVAIR